MAVAEDADPFDMLLNLEEQYYAEGHALGVADGSKAGRIEGRTFGMQTGFEKFSQMGELAGQCAVWEARFLSQGPCRGPKQSLEAEEDKDKHKDKQSDKQGRGVGDRTMTTPAISHISERLQKHLFSLAAMTELSSLDTQNNEEAVAEFDERLKRALAKAKIISSILPDASSSSSCSSAYSGGQSSKHGAASTNMEDFSMPANITR